MNTSFSENPYMCQGFLIRLQVEVAQQFLQFDEHKEYEIMGHCPKFKVRKVCVRKTSEGYLVDGEHMSELCPEKILAIYQRQ